VVLSSRSRRHLVVATGAWAGRTISGEPMPYYRLGLLHPADPPADATAAGIDVDACPSPAEVLEVRENRTALVRGIPDGSPAPDWNWPARACPRPGCPEEACSAGRCLRVVMTEREHRRCAASRGWRRDHDARTARPGAAW
jgi:hypothetical protein